MVRKKTKLQNSLEQMLLTQTDKDSDEKYGFVLDAVGNQVLRHVDRPNAFRERLKESRLYNGEAYDLVKKITDEMKEYLHKNSGKISNVQVAIQNWDNLLKEYKPVESSQDPKVYTTIPIASQNSTSIEDYLQPTTSVPPDEKLPKQHGSDKSFEFSGMMDGIKIDQHTVRNSLAQEKISELTKPLEDLEYGKTVPEENELPEKSEDMRIIAELFKKGNSGIGRASCGIESTEEKLLEDYGKLLEEKQREKIKTVSEKLDFENEPSKRDYSSNAYIAIMQKAWDDIKAQYKHDRDVSEKLRKISKNKKKNPIKEFYSFINLKPIFEINQDNEKIKRFTDRLPKYNLAEKIRSFSNYLPSIIDEGFGSGNSDNPSDNKKGGFKRFVVPSLFTLAATGIIAVGIYNFTKKESKVENYEDLNPIKVERLSTESQKPNLEVLKPAYVNKSKNDFDYLNFKLLKQDGFDDARSNTGFDRTKPLTPQMEGQIRSQVQDQVSKKGYDGLVDFMENIGFKDTSPNIRGNIWENVGYRKLIGDYDIQDPQHNMMLHEKLIQLHEFDGDSVLKLKVPFKHFKNTGYAKMIINPGPYR